MRNVVLTNDSDVFDASAENGVIVFANRGNDSILGSAIADSIYGGYGADTLRGGAGNDLIQDDGGMNFIRGGEGNDVILTGNTGIISEDSLYGGLGDDSIGSGAGHDLVFGNEGNDTLNFSQADFCTINGNQGNDDITGSGEIRGGQGNDVIHSIGTSTVHGDLGNDYMDASNATNGMDGIEMRFVFESGSGVDTISQFELGTDKIVLSVNANGNGITTASDVLSHITLFDGSVSTVTSEPDYVINLGGGNLVYVDIISAPSGEYRTTFTANDFILV